MRLTAQVQPNKSSSKHSSRPTRDCDCVFVVYAFLMFLMTDSQADHFFLCVFWLSGNRLPNQLVFFVFWVFLGPADWWFYCFQWFW